MLRLSPFSTSPLTVSTLAATLGLAAVLVPAVHTVPAVAAQKSVTNCSPPSPVDASVPAPPPAYNVSARNKVEAGKVKIFWKVPSTSVPSGYLLAVRILGSQGRCSKSQENKPGQGCVKTAGKKGFSCILKKLDSGDTEFTVALWFEEPNGASYGPSSYSAPSSTLDVK